MALPEPELKEDERTDDGRAMQVSWATSKAKHDVAATGINDSRC